MAQHVCEASVFERRLRPIYDSLEVGSNKKALQEVEKLLKKTPNLTCARALKALALLRLGKEEESNLLLNALSEEKPSDDATLQVLTFCYKEMEQLEKICELYQHAAKQTPGNEEILAHLFISYVRLNDYKAQQATALQLYKVKQKNPYYFWAVMSVVLQGVRGPESAIPEKRNLYLVLAQRMVDKLISEDKLDAEQEVQLYISILEEQGKYKEALNFMEGSLCQKLYPGAPVSMKISLYKKTEMWDELHLLLKDLLKEERDRWDYYKEYLNCCFELFKRDAGNIYSIFDACHEFLCQLIESGKRVRGPYLARLELYRKMTENNMKANDLLGVFKDLILEYFRLFGGKPCCTNDIAMYINNIQLQDRLDLASMLLRESGISSTTLPQSREQMQKHICSLQLSRICGSHIGLSTEHLLAFYTALRLHYEHGLNAFGRDLLPTDIGPSDAYSLLAAHVMYDISYKENTSNHLLEALCLLHYVLKNSPNNFHAKLLCLKIYHYFGCALGAQQMYESLDIKHVQLDSMGYLHCLLLPFTGLTSVCKVVYDSTLKFFTTSYKERLEYIAMSYKFGSFSKLQEFMDFRDRLSYSIHYATTSAEELLLELVCLSGTVSQNLNTYKLMSIHPQEDRIHWDQLADNRDLSVVVSWNPIDMIDSNAETESFLQDIEALHIRSLLLRLVASFVDIFHFPNRSKKEKCVKSSTATDTIELLKDSWETLFQRLRLKNYEKLSTQFLVNLLPSRLHIMIEMPYYRFVNDLTQFIVDLYNGNNLSPERLKQINENVTEVSNICCESIKKANEDEDNIWVRRDIQARIYSSIEILSLYAFILSICHEKFSTSQNSQGKKYKKKDAKQITDDTNITNMSDKDRLQIIVDLMRHVKQQFQNCNNAIAVWRGPQFHIGLIECMTGMSLNSKTENTLLADIGDTFKENHVQVIRDIRNIIKDKIRMLPTMNEKQQTIDWKTINVVIVVLIHYFVNI